MFCCSVSIRIYNRVPNDYIIFFTMRKQFFFMLIIQLTFYAARSQQDLKNKIRRNADIYLENFSRKYQQLYYDDELATWPLNTKIIKNDTASLNRADQTANALATFTGSKQVVDSVKKYLLKKDKLLPIQVKQFDQILLNAADNPEVAGDIVKRRISLFNIQNSKLYGYKYLIDGKPVTTGDIDSILQNSDDLSMRLKAWSVSKEVGKDLKAGVDSLRYLRNENVKALNFRNFFDYNSQEIIQLTQKFIAELWPLYRELHTWARYELAAKYHQQVPDYIPAHWLPNRWGQDWSSLVNIEALNIDSLLKTHGPEWMAHQSEKFYESIGFDSLPKSFWQKSSLYPVPADSPYTKNNHAFAYHMNLDRDVRSIQSITTTTEYWSTVLHEFGHIYYFLTYSIPEVPILLRSGANPGFHEAFGTMMGLASLQKPFLEHLNMIPKGLKTNDTLKLLKEALSYVVNIPWGSGVMTNFEYDLYAKNLSKDEFNKRWWDLVKKYQGIEPPSLRGEDYCDAASKTHITDIPAQYYEYSIANILLFQFHTYIAKNILKEDVHVTNYWGNKQIGDFLKKIMRYGASIDWQTLLRENINQDMNAKAMLDYFEPLYVYLKHINAGRKYTLPETLTFHE
jgi:peptidyl-dipeptidase A